MNHEGKYFSIYRSWVRDDQDPDRLGRLRLYCPTVMGDEDNSDNWLGWALPSFPWFSNAGVGNIFIPPKGDDWGVWVKFEQGDPRCPVWIGVFPLKPLAVDRTKAVISASDKVIAKADHVELGDDGLSDNPLVNGVVLASGIDTFTGASYGSLNSASSVVTAKKQ